MGQTRAGAQVLPSQSMAAQRKRPHSFLDLGTVSETSLSRQGFQTARDGVGEGKASLGGKP